MSLERRSAPNGYIHLSNLQDTVGLRGSRDRRQRKTREATAGRFSREWDRSKEPEMRVRSGAQSQQFTDVSTGIKADYGGLRARVQEWGVGARRKDGPSVG